MILNNEKEKKIDFRSGVFNIFIEDNIKLEDLPKLSRFFIPSKSNIDKYLRLFERYFRKYKLNGELSLLKKIEKYHENIKDDVEINIIKNIQEFYNLKINFAPDFKFDFDENCKKLNELFIINEKFIKPTDVYKKFFKDILFINTDTLKIRNSKWSI